MFVRVKHMRALLQPRLHGGGGGCIRTRPNSRLVGRVRMHPTYHGSGRLLSHSTLATAPRRLRLRADTQRRGDCLGGPAAQRRLPAPLQAQRCRSRQVSPSEHWPVRLARRQPALRLRVLGAPSLLSIRRYPRRRLPSIGSPRLGPQRSTPWRGRPRQRRSRTWP
jgi:hypothetical protein